MKLGKGSSFVKTHLNQLPQQDETWEADFRAMPPMAGRTEPSYLGLVVLLPNGDPLAYLPVEYTPTVNDLADLLASAMRRPLTGSARRPRYLNIRTGSLWDELIPHLTGLGVEVTHQYELTELEYAYLDFCRQVRKASPGPILMLSPPSNVDRQFPALSDWVQTSGWIEVGQRAGAGVVVRAFDESGLIFENSCTGLTEALDKLEEWLSGRIQ